MCVGHKLPDAIFGIELSDRFLETVGVVSLELDMEMLLLAAGRRVLIVQEYVADALKGKHQHTVIVGTA